MLSPFFLLPKKLCNFFVFSVICVMCVLLHKISLFAAAIHMLCG